MKDLIEKLSLEQFVDWICLTCVDIRHTHSDEDAQEDINKVREALENKFKQLEVKIPHHLKYAEIPAEYPSYAQEIAHQRGWTHCRSFMMKLNHIDE